MVTTPARQMTGGEDEKKNGCRSSGRQPVG